MDVPWPDPYIFTLGPLQLRWFGFLIAIGILTSLGILKSFARSGSWPVPSDRTDKLLIYLVGSTLVGARIGYVIIFQPEYYADNLMEAFSIWRGGLSFHSALFSAALVIWVYAKKNRLSFFQLSDPLLVAATPIIFFACLGNFINGELYGRVTDSWVGITFPAGGPFPRHPSQLYGAFFEGALLFFSLYLAFRRQSYHGITTCLFLIGHGVFNFALGFFQGPDFALRQWLAVIMSLLGVIIWIRLMALKISFSRT